MGLLLRWLILGLISWLRLGLVFVTFFVVLVFILYTGGFHYVRFMLSGC